jgi:hypothetical protein
VDTSGKLVLPPHAVLEPEVEVLFPVAMEEKSSEKQVEGAEPTVIVAVLLQPPTAYVITDVPAATPVTTPVLASTVAIDGVPLDQVPPAGVPVREVVANGATVSVPVMAGPTVIRPETALVVVQVVFETIQ